MLQKKGGDEMMLDWEGYRQELLGRIGDLGRLTPQTVRGYRELGDAGNKTAHLDGKTRELIAIAVGVTRQCDGCITTHVHGARKQGATKEEIAEALGVAITVNAGAALVFSARVIDALTAQPTEYYAGASDNVAEDSARRALVRSDWSRRMSKRSEMVAAEECIAFGAAERQLDAYPNREVKLGDLAIARALPIKDRRLVGPWCFLDRFGPLTFNKGKPMDVAPHPHIGLQTVTWLHAGEVVHDDSLGCNSVLRPGGVNVMTSGGGISHAEQTPRDNTGRLDGVQLWTALPDEHRHMAPGFSHVPEVPAIERPSGVVRIFAGELEAAASPVPYYSALLGADVQVHPRHELMLPLNPAYEHAILGMSGDCSLNGQRLERRMLYYLGTKRSDACFSSESGGRVLLIGGPPFPERILMWWNFVARTGDEIAQARADWEDQRRFGEVKAYAGLRLSAPTLTRFARPNPVS